MTRNVDLQAVRESLRGAALTGFVATDDAAAARSAPAKVGIVKPPPPIPAC